jgi:hypothetical protein
MLCLETRLFSRPPREPVDLEDTLRVAQELASRLDSPLGERYPVQSSECLFSGS